MLVHFLRYGFIKCREARLRSDSDRRNCLRTATCRSGPRTSCAGSDLEEEIHSASESSEELRDTKLTFSPFCVSSFCEILRLDASCVGRDWTLERDFERDRKTGTHSVSAAADVENNG